MPDTMPWIVLWAADKIVVSHWAACLGLVGGSWIFIRGVTNYLRPLTISAYAKDGPAAMVRVVWLGIGLFLVILGSIAGVLGFLCFIVFCLPASRPRTAAEAVERANRRSRVHVDYSSGYGVGSSTLPPEWR